MFDTTDPAAKKAVIDWLLTHGECNTDGEFTDTALARLKVHGVDYERSQVPSFGLVQVESDDVDTTSTYIEAVNARIWPLGGRASLDSRLFVIPTMAWNNLILGVLLRGVLSSPGDTASEWQGRANEAAVAVEEREKARIEERQRLIAEHEQSQRQP